MESFKIVFLLCVVLMASRDNKRSVIAAKGSKCDCGVFKLSTAEKTKDTPLIMKSPEFNFECNAEGKTSCSNMCVALAKAAKEEGPKKICEAVGNSEKPYVPQIYYRACNDDMWSNTGLKSTLKVCCKNKKVISCA